MAKRKVTTKGKTKQAKTTVKTAPAASAYRIEKGVAKPKVVAAGKTPERLTIERLKVGQSFAFGDQRIVKRIKDICYRLKQSSGRSFSVCKMEKGWRAFRDK